MKRWHYGIFSILCSFTLLFCSCNTNGLKTGQEKKIKQKEIIVFAAASLTNVLSELVDSFETSFGANVKMNLASSGTLARQIEQGGTPDVYISASKKWANYIDSLGYVKKGHKSQIAKNELVLIAPARSPLMVEEINNQLQFSTLLGADRLSIGDPSHVPAGRYAKQALEYFGWFEQLKGKLLPAKDVRSALMIVEMEEAPVGIVYKTDAIKSGKVKILASFPEKSHQPIVYVAGVCSGKTISKEFLSYLHSNRTENIWLKYGFAK